MQIASNTSRVLVEGDAVRARSWVLHGFEIVHRKAKVPENGISKVFELILSYNALVMRHAPSYIDIR
jgi:hypothetical protein